MCGVIKEDFGVIGVVVVSIIIKEVISSVMLICLLCYVFDIMEKVFICREVFIFLGIIYINFFNVLIVIFLNIVVFMENFEDVICFCFRRRFLLLFVFIFLLFGLKVIEEYVELLKEWFFDYYGVIIFNVCEY